MGRSPFSAKKCLIFGKRREVSNAFSEDARIGNGAENEHETPNHHQRRRQHDVVARQRAARSTCEAELGANSAAAQSLTYANVTSYFRSTGLKATEVQKRCTVFFEGKWKNANVYDYCLIIVEKSDEDLQVTFYLTDAHEMNWITEFLDTPFFSRKETEQLFGLINGEGNVRNRRIGRFRVDFHRWQPRHAHIIVFSFGPRR